MDIPILSIITINYNNITGLKSTVESVLNQNWSNFEYIIIDGGSTDGSAIYIQSQSENIDYWVSESDKGIYNAMNKGILQAKGKYLLFINSGDCLIDDTVLQNATSSLSSDRSFICGNLYFEIDGQLIVKEHPEQMTFGYLVSKTVYHPSTFIKRELFNKYGLYNEENKIVSDWEFFFKTLGINGETYLKLNQIITNFDMTGISSMNFEKVKAEKESVFKKFMPYIFNNENDSYIFDKFIETNKRFKLLREIDKSPFFRKITTFQMLVTNQLIKIFDKRK